MSQKTVQKMRRSLGMDATNVLLYQMKRHLESADKEVWLPWYDRDLDKMLRNLDSGARRKIRVTLAGRAFISVKPRRVNRGRPEFSWRITLENLAAIQEAFGPIAHDGKVLEIPEVEGAVDKPGLTSLNPDSLKLEEEHEGWGATVEGKRLARERKAKEAQLKKEQEAKEKNDGKKVTGNEAGAGVVGTTQD